MASVAVILRDGENPSALLIRRAEREGDPWSGQVAFPGGKMQEGDRSARDTAAREAREEVGLDPDGDGHFLGYFRSFRTHTGTMEVVPAVFLLKGPGEVRPNAEVSAYKWVPLRALLTPGAKSVYSLRFVDEDREMPAFKVDDFVIWGLTHRILSSLLDVG
ncbi:MAG: CoA pyrophosphatase [Thaumarchaeota archaeon]|nr:CoA pyrophosphatase [Nitrososphaerota archaeon]